MTDSPSDGSQTPALLESLRRREGSWVEWGRRCQALQKAGYSSQAIFEETGFEPGQQNQLMVSSQIYEGLVNNSADPEVLSFFAEKGSDILYEFRLLPQAERIGAATLVQEKNLHQQDAHEVVRALKQMAQRQEPPQGFSRSAGDAVGYHCWRLAQQTDDLQERSRLIARALQFVTTVSAREAVESLLTDFQVRPRPQMPRLPLYRLESQEELPRVLPVAGHWPLATADLKTVPWIEPAGPFRQVSFTGHGAWIALPGWSLIVQAADPVAVLVDPKHIQSILSLASISPSAAELSLLIVDRAERNWRDDRFFLVDEDEHLQISWFEEPPSLPLWGMVLLVVRPPQKSLSENLEDVWSLEE